MMQFLGSEDQKALNKGLKNHLEQHKSPNKPSIFEIFQAGKLAFD